MKRGFYTIMWAQFFSSLADNALFVISVELLRSTHSPSWQEAALVPMFALFYVLLAPFLGAFADALPKGRVMFISNSIKIVGCLLALTGLPPLLAFAVVGLGAAAYSPAKYGILTELLPPRQLVAANGWIEGLTIGSIILGVLLGGQLIGDTVSRFLLSFDFPILDFGIHTAPKAATASLIIVYMLAALFNLRIPRTHAPLRPIRPDTQAGLGISLLALIPDFFHCNTLLWKDKLGQISLATTTLFWGVSANLKYVILAWATWVLGYGTTQGSNLMGVVAVGTAVGAVWASFSVRLSQATQVIPVGIAMGVLVVAMNGIDQVGWAVPFLVLVGGLGGYLVVPMNALLQHRGHQLMGSGRSIAVQNFNEQVCIVGLGLLYSIGTHWGLSPRGGILVFGALVALIMASIGYWHRRNQRVHRRQVHALLRQAQDLS
jgi:LPLT family lysophospholipid transporter-like MFS transporter